MLLSKMTPYSNEINFALEYNNRKVQETNLGLDMNDTHQAQAYADDVILIGDDKRTIERNADLLLNSCKGKLHESGYIIEA